MTKSYWIRRIQCMTKFTISKSILSLLLSRGYRVSHFLWIVLGSDTEYNRVAITEIQGLKQLPLEACLDFLHGTIMLSESGFSFILNLCTQISSSLVHPNSTFSHLYTTLLSTFMYPIYFAATSMTFLTYDIAPSLLLLCEPWHACYMSQQNLDGSSPESHFFPTSSPSHSAQRLCRRTKDRKKRSKFQT